MNPDFTSIVNALERLTAAHRKGAWDYANTIVVGLTLIVLVWYTIETYKLRKAAQKQTEGAGALLEEAQKQNSVAAKLHETALEQNQVTAHLLSEAQLQNDISVMPMFALYVNRNAQASRFLVKNVGLGPAFNVTIKAEVSDTTNLQILPGNDFMAIKEEQELRLHTTLEPGRGQILGVNELYSWINTGKLPNPLSIVIRCVSLHLKTYEFEFRCALEAGHLKVSYHRQSTDLGLR